MIQACGYATDIEYANKLINIVNTYQLIMFNNISEPVEEPDEPIEETEQPFIYTVQAGDSLWEIVRKYYNLDNDTDIYYKVQEVSENNNIEDASMIYPNQEIKLY